MRPPFSSLLAAIWAGFLSPAFGGMEIIAHRGAMSLAPENTLAADPLRRDERPPPAPGFQVSGSPTRSPTATSIDWPVDLREDWNRFVTVTPQVSTGAGTWTDMPPNCCTAVTPSQLLYKFPVGTSGRRFYRLKFEVKP